MSRQAFDQKIQAVKAMQTAAELRKPLRDRNNYIVSKAAEAAARLRFDELIPDLAAAFDRFLTDPVKADPQCWAKNAIAKALQDLNHRDPDVFLKGLTHVQPEPSYGKPQDSAATLRSTCALALVECRIDPLDLLVRLTDLLTDKEDSVRVHAARAIGMVGAPEGALPLRLKALVGDEEPEVVGQCFASLTAIAPDSSIAFVRRFLASTDEAVQAEAASVLAQSRDVDALRIVLDFLKGRVVADVRKSILISLGASPHREAAEYLASVAREGTEDIAKAARVGLHASRFREEFPVEP